MLHALAHRINTRIEGLHGVVDDHTALAKQTDLLRKLQIGPEAHRHYHQIRFDLAAIFKTYAAHALFAEDGGGLLGLEAANGLLKQGMEVTVVHLLYCLMERQLDTPAAALL